MAINLSALSENMTKAVSLSNLILITPQDVIGFQAQNPPNADGSDSKAALPPTFLFDYEGEQVVSLQSDITDHFVESNIAIQDQIALKPEEFTTHGFVGELNDVVPTFLKPLKTAADKLTNIAAYQPSLSTTAELAYAEAFQAYQVAANLANTAVSAWDSLSNVFTGSNGQATIGGGGASAFNFATGKFNDVSVQSKQQLAFQKFYGYWRARTLFSVQTPWALFKNMAIKSLRAIQDAETRMITDFEMTFKIIRTASSLSVTIEADVSGRLNSQKPGAVNNGTFSPQSDIGLGSGLSQMGVA